MNHLNVSNKIDELKQIESISPQIQMNDLMLYRLKKVKQLQNNMKLNELDCKAKSRKKFFFSVNIHCLLYF